MARTIQLFVYKNWGRDVFMYFVLAVIAATFVFLLYFLISKLKIRSSSRYIWLFSVAGLYIYFTVRLRENPEESIHFLEYGLLGFFLFKALGHNIRDKSVYVTASLFALFVGTIDEILQWMMPQRFWDFRDVALNGLSGGLFQLAMWNIIKPKIISEKMNSKSFRLFAFIFASCLIILGLCASNTPQRVASYTKGIPWLSFLQKEEAMSDFGYKYIDEEIGAFYSCLSPKRLQNTDNLMGEQYAQILNASVDEDYEQFIRKYNSITDPFMHELRVHIFRRDTYYEKGKSASKIEEKRESYLIAYKENLILEKYFSHSIKESDYRWNENILKELETSIDKNKTYESPVSANIFTTFSEQTMWIAIFACISLLAIINLIWSYRKKT